MSLEEKNIYILCGSLVSVCNTSTTDSHVSPKAETPVYKIIGKRLNSGDIEYKIETKGQKPTYITLENAPQHKELIEAYNKSPFATPVVSSSDYAIKKNHFGESELHQACVADDLDMARRLIDKGIL